MAGCWRSGVLGGVGVDGEWGCSGVDMRRRLLHPWMGHGSGGGRMGQCSGGDCRSGRWRDGGNV